MPYRIQSMYRFLFICLAAVILNACGDTDNSEPPAELTEFETELNVNELWRANIGEGVEQQYLKLYPLLLNDKIITVDRSGKVSAFDKKTGDSLWHTELDIVVSGGVGGDRHNLVVTGRNGHVILLDGDGKLLWKVDATSEVLMPAQIAAELVILRSVDGRISALDLEDGKEKWSFRRDVPALSLRGNSQSIIQSGYIFTGLDNGRLIVLDLLDGHTIFDIPVSSPSGRSELERMVDIDGHAVIDDDTLYISSYQGRVVALNIRRGQLNWSRKLSSHSGVEYSSSAVYLSDDRDHVWALDAKNGATLWKQDKLQARKLTRPVKFKNALVVADFEGYLHWLSPFDGRFMARVNADDSGILIDPVVENGVLYTVTRDGELIAYSTESR